MTYSLRLACIILLWKVDSTETLLAAFPAFLGELLHIDGLVVLVDDLESQDGFYDILQGHYPLEASVFVDDEGDLFVVLQEAVPDIAQGIFLVEEGDRPLEFLQALVELE